METRDLRDFIKEHCRTAGYYHDWKCGQRKNLLVGSTFVIGNITTVLQGRIFDQHQYSKHYQK